MADLLKEGKPAPAVFDVGHVMGENLLYQANQLAQANCSGFRYILLKRQHSAHGVITLHRPSSVDDPDVMAAVLGSLNLSLEGLPLIFPVHPRTQANLQLRGLIPAPPSTSRGPRRPWTS